MGQASLTAPPHKSRLAATFALFRDGPRGGEGATEIWQSTFVIGLVIAIFGIIGLLAIWAWAHGLSESAKAANNTTFNIWYIFSNHNIKSFNTWSIFSADLLVAGAAAAVGSLLGFVFGIPRTLDPASRVAVASAVSQQGPAASSQAALASNTNLERISDWLTTLLIGATLVQIKDVATWIGELGKDLASGSLSNEHIIPVIVIYFAALSFTGIYLITRLYLTYALQQTLYLLTGSSDQPPVQSLKSDLGDALAMGSITDLARVSDKFRSWKFRGDEAADPVLNYNAARIFGRLLSSNAVDNDKPQIIDKLKEAVQKASVSPILKKQMQDDATNGQLRTGIADVDNDIKRLVS